MNLNISTAKSPFNFALKFATSTGGGLVIVIKSEGAQSPSDYPGSLLQSDMGSLLFIVEVANHPGRGH
jgi:hypothetical protein